MEDIEQKNKTETNKHIEMADCETLDDIVTIKQYLLGCAGQYPVDDNTLAYLSVKCGVSLDSDVSVLTELEKDRLEMTMLRYILGQPGMTASISDANGSWSHKEGAVEMNSKDKEYLNNRYIALERKYNISTSTVKMHNLGSRIYGKV